MKTVPLKFQSSSRSSAPRGGKVAVRSVGVLKSRPSSFAVPSVVLSFLLVSALLSFNCSNKHEQGFVQFVEALSCSENNGECGSNSYCINVSNGAVSCTCWKGYQSAGGGRPGSNCVDIDECAGNVCPANSTCVNTPGSYECNCNEGFEKGENNDCIAQLRCSKDNDCDPIFAECVQLESKYECKCLQFFNGSGKVNECV
ncbi:calcium binding egf domain-containing protein, partial [Cystoisospora suis]